MPVVGKFKSKNSHYSASLQDYPSKLKHKACLQPCVQPRFEGQEPCTNSLATRNSDLGPRTGVTVDVSLSGLDFVEGGGAAGQRGLRLGEPVYLMGWQRQPDL